MNLSLLDPRTTSEPPDRVDGIIDCPCHTATCCQFSRHGAYLAVGGSNGQIYIIDFITRGIVRHFFAHARPISMVSWNRRGNMILSCSIDGTIRQWDVSSHFISSSKFSYKLENESLASIQFHPRNSEFCLVTTIQNYPILFNLFQGSSERLYFKEEEKDPSSKAKSLNERFLGIFSKDGENIYIGGSKGKLLIFETKTKQIKKELKVPGKSQIKNMKLSPNGNMILLNSADRILRVYHLIAETFISEFQEPVNRLAWKSCCFSSDNEYVLGGSSEDAQHHIYIWSCTGGHLVEQLTGPREQLMNMAYHPLRSYLVNTTREGRVIVWGRNPQANWSAFTSDFEVLEENEEYIEAEDEFDLNKKSNDETELKKKESDEIEADIDILTVDRIGALDSDTENEEDYVLTVEPIEQSFLVPPRFNQPDEIEEEEDLYIASNTFFLQKQAMKRAKQQEKRKFSSQATTSNSSVSSIGSTCEVTTDEKESTKDTSSPVKSKRKGSTSSTTNSPTKKSSSTKKIKKSTYSNNSEDNDEEEEEEDL